jgi:hypothetical protein
VICTSGDCQVDCNDANTCGCTGQGCDVQN